MPSRGDIEQRLPGGRLVGAGGVGSRVEEHECSNPFGRQTPHLECDSATHRVADDIDGVIDHVQRRARHRRQVVEL